MDRPLVIFLGICLFLIALLGGGMSNQGSGTQIAARYHLRNRTSHFYQRATKSVQPAQSVRWQHRPTVVPAAQRQSVPDNPHQSTVPDVTKGRA